MCITKSQKIVLAATTLCTGGIGSYLLNIASGLKDRGWQVELLVTHIHGDLFKRTCSEYMCHDLTIISSSYKKVLEVARIVNNICPDILLINHCPLVHYAMPLIQKSVKPVSVVHSKDSRFYEVAALFSRRIFRWIAPSSGVAQYCKSYIPDESNDRIKVIHHGIDEKTFGLLKKDIDRSIGKITSIGFIGENKGVDLLPDIMKLIIRQYPKACLTLIGDGPLLDELKYSFSRYGLMDQCSFKGILDFEQVAEVLRESVIFLSPTRIEGFGLSIIEAMMCGAVPVVSRVEGVTDHIIIDRMNGRLIDIDNIKGFVDAVIDLIKNPEYLREMSKEARITAMNRFTLKNMINSYEILFAENDDRISDLGTGPLVWVKEFLREIIKRYAVKYLPKKIFATIIL